MLFRSDARSNTVLQISRINCGESETGSDKLPHEGSSGAITTTPTDPITDFLQSLSSSLLHLRPHLVSLGVESAEHLNILARMPGDLRDRWFDGVLVQRGLCTEFELLVVKWGIERREI